MPSGTATVTVTFVEETESQMSSTLSTTVGRFTYSPLSGSTVSSVPISAPMTTQRVSGNLPAAVVNMMPDIASGRPVNRRAQQIETVNPAVAHAAMPPAFGREAAPALTSGAMLLLQLRNPQHTQLMSVRLRLKMLQQKSYR
jgi:hypothetical protein